jgi:hypothetical protein
MSPAPLCPALLKLNVERALVWRYEPRLTKASQTATHVNQISVRHFCDLSPELLHVELFKADGHWNLANCGIFRGRVKRENVSSAIPIELMQAEQSIVALIVHILSFRNVSLDLLSRLRLRS